MARIKTELTRLPEGVGTLAIGLSAVIIAVSLLAAIDGFLTPIPPFDFGEELEDGFRVAPLLGSALFAATAVLACSSVHGARSQLDAGRGC